MKKKEKESIPIFLSSDNNYAPFVATTIASICDNTESYCDFYILDGGIDEENKKKICSLEEIYKNLSIEYITIDKQTLASIEYKNSANHVTLSTYNRILIPILKPDIDKAIYLDVDIIAKGDIKSLYNESLDGYALGAVWRKFTANNEKEINQKLNISINHKYFNAGVLLIDCKKWRDNNITQKLFLTEKENRDRISLADQDILNIFFCNNYKNLTSKYNYQTPYYILEKEHSFILRHFSDSIKPWNLSENQDTPLMPDNSLFWKYAHKTLFYDKIKTNLRQDAIRKLRILNILNKSCITGAPSA